MSKYAICYTCILMQFECFNLQFIEEGLNHIAIKLKIFNTPERNFLSLIATKLIFIILGVLQNVSLIVMGYRHMPIKLTKLVTPKTKKMS